MSSPETENPLNPLPPVVMALFLAIIGVEIAFQLGTRGVIGGPGALGWRQIALQDYAFNAQVMDWMSTNGVYPPAHLMRFFTFPFVHGNFTHALFAGVMLLAMGKFVGEVFSGWAVLAVFILSSAMGAFVYGLLVLDPPWVFGAFPGAYGLIGAFTYLLWLRLGQLGAQQARAFTLIGFLMAVQLLFSLVFGANMQWLADVAGFASGFVLSFVVSPGGWAKIRAKLLQR
ncbi:rhomboid family intramembrane serine protease [Roseovarius spongiae]|uniref:Rhomboid family intramembrane serine protease n=1 Tax=Roseovarius spongiae TaxID=2320272 RepID=A0A3A8B4R4_9RHOB|nr:rhomboid family intramembrane serine protease [Roseovarius spongiae]RKF13607.1 rhomboid family intramembrane serine protease [Roseovarius spongiae]